MNIALCDLSYFNKHTKMSTFIPLGIGYLASYLKTHFKDEVEIELFKDPNELLEYCKNKKPEIVGFAYYDWNIALNQSTGRLVRKELEDKVTIVAGGPSIDSDKYQQELFIKEHNHLDYLVSGEGEMALKNIVEQHLRNLQELPKGASYINNGVLTYESGIGNSLSLSDLPSPILNGYLDKFLNGFHHPMVQTSRLCPYTCTFCVAGKSNGNLKVFSQETVENEVTYLAKKFSNNPDLILYLVDDNFGLFERDEPIADFILKISNDLKFPKRVFFYTDKKFKSHAKYVLQKLSPLTTHGLSISLQSENDDVLSAVGRKNLSDDEINDALQWATDNDVYTTTELIFGLPNETYDTFHKTLENSLRKGYDSILCHNLIMLNGSRMNSIAYRETHNIQTKYRLAGIGVNYAWIGSEFTCEVEEIVTSSESFSFEEFIKIRQLNFMFFTVFSLDLYKWFFQFLRLEEISITDLFTKFLNPDKSQTWPKEYLQFITDFNLAINGEFFDTKEEVADYAKECWSKNNNNVGEPSRINVYYGARLIYMEKWTAEVLFRVLQDSLEDGSSILDKASQILEVCKHERIDLREISSRPKIAFNYDLNLWKKSKFAKTIDHYYIGENLLSFEIEKDQEEKVLSFSKNYGDLDDLDFYYNAVDYITPRYKTLYKLNMEKT